MLTQEKELTQDGQETVDVVCPECGCTITRVVSNERQCVKCGLVVQGSKTP